MPKLVRNTVFTALILVLTSLGLNWNKNTAAANRPVSLEQAVLASQSATDTATAFPLSIGLGSPSVRLGELETVAIQTVPDASLQIVTVYPNGSTDHPQTLRAKADGNGLFTMQFTITDFHHLGLFQVSAVATSGNKTAETTNRFVVQNWTGVSSTTPDYLYPIAP